MKLELNELHNKRKKIAFNLHLSSANIHCNVSI